MNEIIRSPFLIHLNFYPIQSRTLFLLKNSPCPFYTLQGGIWTLLVSKDQIIHRDLIQNLVNQRRNELFLKVGDKDEFLSKWMEEILQESLILIRRPKELFYYKRYLYKLTLLYHLFFIFNDDEKVLIKLSKMARIFADTIQEKVDFISPLYKFISNQKFHYLNVQPLLSSLFLIKVLIELRAFSSQEIADLFVVSFLKDVGMSVISKEIYSKENLSEFEISSLLRHEKHSRLILSEVIKLSDRHLNLIENHHHYSNLKEKLITIKTKNSNIRLSESPLMGLETELVEICDIIVAMISSRPYRDGLETFETLNRVKLVLEKRYYSEFKILISVAQNLFK